MIHQFTNPVGIDVAIYNLQKDLYAFVKRIWKLEDVDYESYPRCYRNQTENGYIPEMYIGPNDYKDVFGSDTSILQTFFGLSGKEQQVDGGQVRAEAHIVFFVNIDQVFAKLERSLDHRGDEELHRDIYRYFNQPRYGFTYKETVTGVDEVYKEYSARKKMDYRDMHPTHYFRLNFTLYFNPKDCINTGPRYIGKQNN